MRPALLLLLLLGVLCRRGHADDTTALVTTIKESTSLGTTSATQSSGATVVTTPTAAAPGTPTTTSTTLSSQTTASSSQTTGPRETTTPKESSTGSASTPAGSSLGATTVKPASSVRTSTSDVAAATTPGPVSPPTSGVTATQPPPALSPSSAAVGTTGTTSSVSTSPKSVASTSLAQKPTNVAAATSPAVTPSQGHAGVTQGSTAVSQGYVTTANGQSAGSPGGSVAPAAGQPTPSKETQATTSTKPEGTPGTTVHPSSHAGSQATPSSPGVSVSTTIKGPPAQHNPPADKGNHTWFLSQIQIMCESAIPSENQAIVLTLNESTSCDHLTKSSVADPLLNTLCKTIKPNFNQSQDQCVVRLAPVADNPKGLAIVGISVQIHAVADELYESLKIKQAELAKLGVKNITYDGQIATLESEDRFSMPLIITIVCMAASLLLVAAIYGCCHQRISQRKDQRLTEELQTMENGYHDNPTLEVMETSSEMQEKKVNLNGELGDSWIVPMDNLTKEDLDEEEDTHL
ncbi:podocalyxin isoform X2 [Eublepharis macularius]|uniref:Podocalyxin n=1 Tax=Eublepharis macularius TaxID=481883 RepID=A0AA97JXT0_EUBMA|nr:podocalyxin isoform X2 [Eublepharis macularius]